MSLTALVVDNRDSFVFNLVHEVERLGISCTVVRGGTGLDRMEALVDELVPCLVLLSPGPGRPEEAGVMVPFLRKRLPIPVLGVCLGMQAMAVATGGRIGPAERPLHGRSSLIEHGGDPLFAGIPSPFPGARYHSLVVTDLGEELHAVASSRDEETGERLVMGLRHVSLPWYGLQFHPESLLTPFGPRIVQNLVSEIV